MQGKFKLVVLNDVGHVIHEDKPRAVAEVFKEFLATFKIPVNFNARMTITSVSGKEVVIGGN